MYLTTRPIKYQQLDKCKSQEISNSNISNKSKTYSS